MDALKAAMHANMRVFREVDAAHATIAFFFIILKICPPFILFSKWKSIHALTMFNGFLYHFDISREL